jgi:predicted nucleic acid-binding protein
MNDTVVVADTSCLIILERIGELSLLQKLFKNVLVTREVAREFGNTLPDWITVRNVATGKHAHTLQLLLLDSGESSSILLAIEKSALLIIDEKKGRRIASELGVRILGTLGMISIANERGLIDSIESLVEAIEREGFFISGSLREKLLSAK